jgi:hypothetical protein
MFHAMVVWMFFKGAEEEVFPMGKRKQTNTYPVRLLFGNINDAFELSLIIVYEDHHARGRIMVEWEREEKIFFWDKPEAEVEITRELVEGRWEVASVIARIPRNWQFPH